MAITYGQTGSYNRSVGVKIDMDEAIVILTPDDVPLQQWMSSEPTASIKVEWMEEDLTPSVDTVSAVSGTGPWTVTVGDTNIFRVGDLLHKKDGAHTLQYVVQSVTNGTVMVVAGFNGNTTGFTVNDVVEIIGQTRNEGSDPLDARSVERVAKFNYTQMAQEKVEVTRTQRGRAMYAQVDPYDHEVMKKFKELAIRYERSLVNGVRWISGDEKQRMMGGLFYYISSNTASNTAANVKTAINSLLRQCYDDGGDPRVLMVSPAVKAAIDANYDPTLRRWSVQDTAHDGRVETITTSFGNVQVVINRHFPLTKGLVLQREFLKRKVFDGYFHEMLAKTGDAEKGQIVAELSCEVKNEKAHGILTVTDAA